MSSRSSHFTDTHSTLQQFNNTETNAKLIQNLLPSHPTNTPKSLLPGAALYIHIPFCFHKCHYCDFYSIVDQKDRQAQFTTRLINEITAVAAAYPHPISTIFIGGGTPTLLAPDLFKSLLQALHTHFNLANLTEFTVEANPETVTQPLLETLATHGVNRISIGAQTFNTDHLQTLERWHDPQNVNRAIELARAAGIANINIDLIYAIPNQNLDDWHTDLDQALDLQTTHLSCYSLMFEPQTPLTKKLDLGKIERCDNALEADMFLATIDRLNTAGFQHYEISNFAKPSRQCRHNLIYWLNQNYLPLGPSAAGHLHHTRFKNIPHLGKYLDSTHGSPLLETETLTREQQIGEQLMLGLRLIDGIDLTPILHELSPQRQATIQSHINEGNLNQSNNTLKLTPQGLLLADTVISDLL